MSPGTESRRIFTMTCSPRHQYSPLSNLKVSAPSGAGLPSVACSQDAFSSTEPMGMST